MKLAIVGNGTKAGLGRPTDCRDTLSSADLAGIVAYNPAEMVMTARAGTPLETVLQALDEAGQMLAFEPADYSALYGSEGQPTIGGVFACNLSGPRRLLAGAARDHLLGVEFVNGKGEIVRAGGRVMKNVTGLDLAKVLCGSFGSLAFLTELTFKVLPKPETANTIILSDIDDEIAAGAMARAMALPADISSAAYLPESCRWNFLGGTLPSGGVSAFRIEGKSFSVEERTVKVKAELGKSGSLTVLGHDDSSRLWREIADIHPFAADGRERPVWKVSVAPMAGYRVMSALRMQAGVDAYYDWQGGLIWLRMEADPEADLLRGLIAHFGGGHATLVRATEAQRRTIPIFQPQSGPLAMLSRRIGAAFDPNRVFADRTDLVADGKDQ